MSAFSILLIAATLCCGLVAGMTLVFAIVDVRAFAPHVSATKRLGGRGLHTTPSRGLYRRVVKLKNAVDDVRVVAPGRQRRRRGSVVQIK